MRKWDRAGDRAELKSTWQNFVKSYSPIWPHLLFAAALPLLILFSDGIRAAAGVTMGVVWGLLWGMASEVSRQKHLRNPN